MHNPATGNAYQTLFYWLLAVAALLLLVRLGSAPIYILDEAKNAQCAREMWQRNDWILPTFNGQLRTDKPALHYWCMRLAYAAAGATPAAARFFSAVVGILLVAVTFRHTRRHAGAGVAFFSALALVLSTHYLFEFRLSVPDPYLIFFTATGLFCSYQYLVTQKTTPMLWAAVSLGLAVLAKGPVAIVLPGAAILLFAALTRRWKLLANPWLVAAVLLALIIAVPWYYAVHKVSNGAFTRGFFLEHNLNRFSDEKEGHGGPFFITILIVLIGMLPFSLVALAALRKKSGFFKQPLFLFSAIVVAVYIVFFSISSTKLPNYPMPCYPFAAIMAGYLLHDYATGKWLLPGWVWITWLLLACAIPAGAWVALRQETVLASFAWVAWLLLVLPAGVLGGIWFRGRPKLALGALAAGWVGFAAVFLWVGYPLIYSQNPVAKLAPLILDKQAVAAYRAYNPAFNFNFPAQAQIIPMINQPDSLLRPSTVAGPAPYYRYIITRSAYASEVQAAGYRVIGEYRDLFELPTTVILERKP